MNPNNNPQDSDPKDPPAPVEPSKNDPPAKDDFKPEALSQEQINAVLEKNPHIWKADRIAGLREKAKKFDDAETARQQADEQKLKDDKKFEELSQKQETKISDLTQTIQGNVITQELTAKLVPLGIVDLNDALRLVDRDGIKVADDGTISGIDEAIETLKTKKYLFTSGEPLVIGSPSNPGNGGEGGGPATFKRSQLSDSAFYKEHRDEILKAMAAGKIEDDLKRS